MTLASQIKPALLEAGLSVDDRPSCFVTGVWVNGPQADQDLVKAIANSLASDGKLITVNKGADQIAGANPADGLNILVGIKPLPPQPK